MRKKYQRRPCAGRGNRSPGGRNTAAIPGPRVAWAALASYALGEVLTQTKSQTLLLSLATAG